MPMSDELVMSTMGDGATETTTHDDYEYEEDHTTHHPDDDPLGRALDELAAKGDKKEMDEMMSGVTYEDEATSSTEEVHDSSMAPDDDASSSSSHSSSEEMTTKKPKSTTAKDDDDTETEMAGTVSKKNYDAMPEVCRPYVTMTSPMTEKSRMS